MTRSEKIEIRNLFDELHFICSLYKTYATLELSAEERAAIDKIRADRIRSLRRKIRTFYQYHPDPLGKSLLTGTRRVIWKHDGDEDISDGPTYFWIDPDTSLTDDEIDEIRQDESFRCTSPYDCCGQQFTWAFSANRTPAGIAFINRTGFDY